MSRAIVSTRTRINNDINNKCHIKDAFLAENQMKNKCKYGVIISNENSPCALYYDHKKIEKKRALDELI